MTTPTTPTGKRLVKEAAYRDGSGIKADIVAIEREAAAMGQEARAMERERLRAECADNEHIRRMGAGVCFNCDPVHGLLTDPEPDR